MFLNLLNVLTTTTAEAGHAQQCLGSISAVPLRVVVGVTCALSMFGSVLIILSYCIVPGIRTKGREILVNLSIMDFVAAAANGTGIAVNFDQYLGNVSDNSSHDVMNRVCVTQAVFAQYGTVSSILWTISLAVYIYFCVMVTNKTIAFRSVYVFYVLSYGLPAFVSIWYIATGKLGFDRLGGSGWCTVLTNKQGKLQALNIFFTSDMWVYLTMFLVPVIVVALHYHLKNEMKRNETMLTQSWKATMQNVEVKLLFIPIIFILLRIWSLVFIIIVVYAGYHPKCSVIKFFLYISGIGDSGQGFANGLLYVLFSSKVRQYFLNILLCRKEGFPTVSSCSRQGSHHGKLYGSFSSDFRRSEDRDSEDGSDGGDTGSNHHKSLLLNS